MMPKERSQGDDLTIAELRGLVHVAADKVTNKFTASGNVFVGPRGTASSTYRKLARRRLIENVPGQKGGGVYASHFYQQLTSAGRAALDKATGTQS